MLDSRGYSCQENCKSKSSKGKGKIIFGSSFASSGACMLVWAAKHHWLEAESTAVNWLTVVGATSPRSECQHDPVLMEALPCAY